MAVLLITAGIGMVTANTDSTEKMAVGVLLIVLGFIAFIMKETWNESSWKRRETISAEPEKTLPRNRPSIVSITERRSKDIEEAIEEVRRSSKKPKKKRRSGKKNDNDFWKDART